MKICKSCGQVISDALLRKKRKLKSQRIKAGLAKAIAEGRHVGRLKKRNDFEIHRLRAMGLSIRQIAKNQNISTGSVQLSLKIKRLKLYWRL